MTTTQKPFQMPAKKTAAPAEIKLAQVTRGNDLSEVTGENKAPFSGKLKKGDIATIRKQVLKDGSEKRKIVFNSDVEIYYRGQKVDMGQYRSFFLKDSNEIEENLQYSVAQGWKTEEQAEKDRAFNEEKQVKMSLQVSLFSNEG